MGYLGKDGRPVYFGEMALLSDKIFGQRRFTTQERRSCTITAQTICDVLTLTSFDLKQVARDFPYVLEHLYKQATERKIEDQLDPNLGFNERRDDDRLTDVLAGGECAPGSELSGCSATPAAVSKDPKSEPPAGSEGDSISSAPAAGRASHSRKASARKSNLGVCLQDNEGQPAALDAVPIEDADGTEEMERGNDSFSKANIQRAGCCSMANATCSCSPLFQISTPRQLPGPEAMSEMELPEVMVSSTTRALVAESPPNAGASTGGIMRILQEMSKRSERAERRVLEVNAIYRPAPCIKLTIAIE